MQPAVAAPRTPEPTPEQQKPKVIELSPDTAQLVYALLALEPTEPGLAWWATPESEATAEVEAKLDELGSRAKEEQFTEWASRILPDDRQKALALFRKEKAARLLLLLPDEPSVHDEVYSWYLSGAHTKGEDLGLEPSTELWLQRNTRYCREQLLVDVANITYKDGVIAHALDLRALARLDWPRAQQEIARLAESSHQPLVALARAVEFEHTVSPEARKALERLATDRNADPLARNLAIEGLMKPKWEGREELYVRLMADPTLQELRSEPDAHQGVEDEEVSLDELYSGENRSGYQLYQPLATPVWENPDRWIPLVASLVGNSDIATHNNAVSVLVGFQLETARADALQPLLPWLDDPKWSNARDRLRLIQSLGIRKLPGAGQGLFKALTNSEDSAERAYAADSLVSYPDPEFVPTLLRVLKADDPEWGDDDRQRFLEALLACGHFSQKERVEALMAFSEVADEWLRISGAGDGLVRNSDQALLGELLLEEQLFSDDLVRVCIQRLDATQEQAKKRRLERVILAMETPATDEYVLRELASGRPSDQLVNSALTRREDLAKTQASLLDNMTDGAAKGLAASILQKGRASILSGTDVEAQAVLLACARLTSDTLPVELVEPLMTTAAEASVRAYLIALDTEEAQVALRRHPKGSPPILGRSGGRLAQLTQAPEKQMREILKDEPEVTDIYALFTTGYYEGYGHFVLRVGKAKAEMYWYKGDETYRLRTLSVREREEFLDFIEREKIDSLKMLNNFSTRKVECHYVHLSREGGRRVHFYSPAQTVAKGQPYEALVDQFRSLVDEKAETKSNLVEAVPGGKILFQATGEKQVGEIRGTKNGEIYLRMTGPAFSENSSQSKAESGRLKTVDSPWRLLVDGRLKRVEQAPWKDEKLPSHLDSPEGLCTTVRGVARVGERGLYLYDAKGKKALLAAGTFANPIASADGRWLACARKAGPDWLEPNEVVLVEVESGRVLDTKLLPEETLDPIGYLKSQNAFLIFRKKDKAKVGEAHLLFLDGTSRRAEGEFQPYLDALERPLQVRGQEFWAVLPSKDRGIDLGLYDAEKLTFRFWTKLPVVSVGSESVWVDEKAGLIYLISEGSLISVPLEAKPAGWL